MNPLKQPDCPWKNMQLPRKCLVWVVAVDQILWRDWYTNSSDAGWDRDQLIRYWQYGDTPEAFVDWFADKYDLIRFD